MKSDPHEMLPAMVNDPENHARLSGLLAMLALPLLNTGAGRMKRVRVEVEVAPGRWVDVLGAAVELGKLTIWMGDNGTRQQWEFAATECPRWRTPRELAAPYITQDPHRVTT